MPILVKAIPYIIGNDIQLTASALQTCAWQDAGTEAEAAIYAIKKEDIDAVMLIMSITELIVKLFFTTLTSFAHPLVPLYKTLMVCPSDCLLPVKKSSPLLRAPHRVTLLPWPCMPWL